MKKIWKNEEGVSPVIAVILMVAITVVLAAVLYVMVSGMMTGTTTAPTGAFAFNADTETDGKYIGTLVSLSSDVKLSDASITILDASNGGSAAQGPPVVSGSVIQVTSPSTGMNLTYTDTNGNSKLDAGDVWVIQGGAVNDEVRLIHKTGKAIATYKVV